VNIVETERQVFAVDDDDVEICGAFNPVGHEYYQFYVTWKVVNLTGLQTPPHQEHFIGELGRVYARQWIELIAALYSLATQQHSTMQATNGHDNTEFIREATQP
jgi:hypothetical protein